MALKTSQLPTSVHSDIDPSAVAEVLMMHYNVGITNPWYEAGLSDQETYNRRRLPWSGRNYHVDEDGNVSGPNLENVKDSLQERWAALAESSRENLKGNVYGDLEELYNDGLTEVGNDLREDTVELTTVSGDTVSRLESELSDAQMQEQGING